MQTQICTKCKLEKPLDDFYNNKNTKSGKTYKCKGCFSEANKKFLDDNPEYYKNYAKNNQSKIRKHKQKYYENNIEKCRKSVKKYESSKKGKIKRRARQKQRIKSDPMYQLKKNLRSRIWSVFKNNKDKNTKELLGCNFETAKAHIENQFTKGMTWENYGEWHVDHKIPLASAITLEDVEKLCHYTNLQPLWAEDNQSKKDKF